MKINTILAIILAGICYIILPFLILLIKNEKAKKTISIITLAAFVCILLVGVWGNNNFSKNEITIGFDFSGKWCDKTMKWDFQNITTFDLVINLVMLFPIGIFAFDFLKNKKLWQKLLILFAIGLFCGSFIELSQYILPIPRSVQFSDIVFNTISVVVGGMICWFYQFVISKIRKSKTDKTAE